MSNSFYYQPFQKLPHCDQSFQSPVQTPEGNVTCSDLYQKIITVRVYFVLIIVNFLFVVITTSYFVYRYLSPKDMTSASRQWQNYSLKKRSIFVTVLGATGHCIFSTSILLNQVIVTTFTCDIYLWCPMIGLYLWMYSMLWRAHRLHFLIQTSELQKRFFYQQNTSIQTYAWFIQHRNALNKSTAYCLVFFVISMVLLITIVVLGEVLGLRPPGTSAQSNCQFPFGNYVVMGMVSFFFLILVPFIVWHVRNDDDAHGIRQEIRITLSVGVPCFICFIVWQVLFALPTFAKPINPRGYFGPGNWIVLMTTSNHIMSVIYPLFKTLSVTKKPHRKSRDLYNMVTRHSLSTGSEQARANQATENQTQEWEQQLDLTTESLNYALHTPTLLKVLQSWAVKDFTIENILFYDRYLCLVHAIERRIAKEPHHSFYRGSMTIVEENTSVLSELDRDVTSPSQEVLNTPFVEGEVSALVTFYDTFITEQAPLQVNISHKARHTIDMVMAPLYQNKTTYKKKKSGIPNFLWQKEEGNMHQEEQEDSIKITIDDDSSTNSLVISSVLRDQQKNEKLSHSIQEGDKGVVLLSKINSNQHYHPTLQVFEEARKEVFWNIYSGLFPKVVEALNHTNPG